MSVNKIAQSSLMDTADSVDCCMLLACRSCGSAPLVEDLPGFDGGHCRQRHAGRVRGRVLRTTVFEVTSDMCFRCESRS